MQRRSLNESKTQQDLKQPPFNDPMLCQSYQLGRVATTVNEFYIIVPEASTVDQLLIATSTFARSSFGPSAKETIRL